MGCPNSKEKQFHSTYMRDITIIKENKFSTKKKISSKDFDDDIYALKKKQNSSKKKEKDESLKKKNKQQQQTSSKSCNVKEDIDTLKPIYQQQAVAKYQEKFDAGVTAKYEIKALIGKGSFSRVVRVEHRLTHQPYAIKLINKREACGVFEAELRVLRRVRHENVIRLVEVYDTPAKVYLVMELATGGELLDRIIEKGCVTELDAIRVIKMVLQGLRYLHDLGITHRDLKPENLLYYHPGENSRIIITDFGLSHVRDSGCSAYMNTTCGTPEYIAPEILARRPYTNAVDLWATGVITYILLSGRMPFDAEQRPLLYRQILKANYSYRNEPWADISNLAKDFNDKLLVVDATARLTAAQALKHPWICSSTLGSGAKNLHRTISRNILQRQSTRTSSRSQRSTRSQPHRVHPDELEQLHQDPEIQAELSSLGSTPK